MTKQFEALLTQYPVLATIQTELCAAHDLLCRCYDAGGKLLVCGNGGSAADSAHIVGELMKGFLLPRPLNKAETARFDALEGTEALAKGLQGALPAIDLTANAALLSAVANDGDADMIFAQQVFGYAKEEDCLLAMSTSGNSRNILNALKTAAVKGIPSIGITGANGGAAKALCSVCICLPETETYKVQELTLPLYHALCAALEARYFQ